MGTPVKMHTISLCVATAILVVLVNTSDLSSDTYCEGNGWEPYRDEKCLKLIKDFKTRDQASEVCAQELIKSDTSTPELVSIKSEQEQEFLSEFLFNSSDVEINVWIGAKRASGNEFVWDDGSKVEYANWDQGSPTEENRKGCVVIQSEFGRKFAESDLRTSRIGKWRDVICGQAYYVLCQKMQRWSFGKLQQALLETRKQLVDSNEALTAELGDTKSQLVSTQNELSVTKTDLSATKTDLSTTKSELSATKTDLSTTKSELSATKTDLSSTKSELSATKTDLSSTKNELSATKTDLSSTKSELSATKSELSNLKQTIIPIGFIYTQLPSDKAPNEIWPWMTWTDVSSSYAGVFFRVAGGAAAPIGQVQAENAPRLTKVANIGQRSGPSGERTLPLDAWTEILWTGGDGGSNHVFLKFYTSGGEVRPRNMAIRIWRRTG